MRFLLASSALVVVLGGVAVAEPPAPAGKKAPVVATDAEAAAAVETYKVDFKAKGLTGEERLSQRDFAMAKLAKIQHLAVVAELGAVSRSGDPILRTLAIIYLGQQTAFPGPAGGHIATAMKKFPEDRVLLMSALQSIGRLRYVGAREQIRASLVDQDYALKKTAIATVGDTGDVRLLGDLLKMIGIQLEKNDGSGQAEATGGYSWDGVSVNVDTGTAGDGDQREAERQGQQQLAANQAAAAAGAGGGDGGGGPGGGSSRSPAELVPGILSTLKKITGQTFKSAGECLKWLAAHDSDIKAMEKALDATEKEQRAKPAAKK